MPEPLKNAYNKKFIATLSKEISHVYPTFQSSEFQRSIFDADWKHKELKQRMRHITETLAAHLPDDYAKALTILKPASEKFSGFEPMFFPDYVELYGMDHYQESIIALEHFTQFSSSEFAVRPFIIHYEKAMMKQMATWSKSKNYHVRRLASEGCRPRLPWANALPEFKNNPSAILPILNQLKADESEYVRRSVANNLNDIAKDHPETVLDIAQDWLGNSEETDKLVKHACRTLLKKGHPKALKLFGLSPPKHIQIENFKAQKKVAFGGNLKFSFALITQRKTLGKIRIEFAIDYMKSNGKLSRKVFKISELNCTEKEKAIKKTHSFQERSTRKHYPGRHQLTLLVNGVEMAQEEFKLNRAKA